MFHYIYYEYPHYSPFLLLPIPFEKINQKKNIFQNICTFTHIYIYIFIFMFIFIFIYMCKYPLLPKSCAFLKI